MKIPAQEKVKYKNISISLPEGVRTRAQNYAESKNLKLSTIVEMLLCRQMDIEKFQVPQASPAAAVKLRRGAAAD